MSDRKTPLCPMLAQGYWTDPNSTISGLEPICACMGSRCAWWVEYRRVVHAHVGSELTGTGYCGRVCPDEPNIFADPAAPKED